MKRKVLALAGSIVLFALAFVGCDNGVARDPKPVTGIDPIFAEGMGINNESPSVFEENGERYVFFTRQEKGEGKTIALSKGTKKQGEWKYGDVKTVLSPDSDSDWEYAGVYAPTVVKGDFKFKAESYSYLMAYAATASVWSESQANAQIGFAVAKSAAGPYVRIGKPALSFDVYEWSYHGNLKARGATEPSLVSFDKGSKVWLFYTFCAPGLAASVKCMELDLSGDLKDFASVPAYQGSTVTVAGADDYEGQGLINSDWTYIRSENGYGKMLATGDSFPFEEEPALSASVGIYRADTERALYEVREDASSPVWEWLDSIDFTKTAILSDETRMAGYARIFSAGFLRDEYGTVLGEDTVEVVFSSSPDKTDEFDYEYCKAIHTVTVHI